MLICFRCSQLVSILGEFPFNNPSTNIGYVVSPIMENLYPDGTSIKLVVHPHLLNNDKDPIPSITFTCNGKLKKNLLKFCFLSLSLFYV